MIIDNTPLQNSILQTLTVNEYKNISAHLEQVQTFFGEVLYESDEESPYVYFPTSSVISMHAILENGSYSEIAKIGNLGGVGVTSLTNELTAPHMAMVTKGGISYRLKKHLMTLKLKSLLVSDFKTRIYGLEPHTKVHSFAA